MAVIPLGFGDPDRLDTQELAVETPNVVLAVVEGRAPSGALELAALPRQQEPVPTLPVLLRRSHAPHEDPV